MHKSVYLCGHTGSTNRGCEAIVRSTVKILRQSGVQKCRLYSYNVASDEKSGLTEVVPVNRYKYWPKLLRGVCRYILKNPVMAHNAAYRKILRKGKPDCMVCVGGDTYCSNLPYGNYAINNTAKQYQIPTVLWGCSVDERVKENAVMKRDVQKYDHLVARETLTYEILRECKTENQKLWLACDPAFHLDTQVTTLPAVFARGDVVGINLSPFFVDAIENEDEKIYRGVKLLIEYILEETDMNICFIPHVYDFPKGNEDIAVLSFLQKNYADEPRIDFLKEDLSCTQIKYVISQCRFFVGARTHSIIAAYSSAVPALALSYSIKSLGIAKDLFGTHEGYVLSKADMQREDALKETFVRNILQNEAQIRRTYSEILPQYTQSILAVAKSIF